MVSPLSAGDVDPATANGWHPDDPGPSDPAGSAANDQFEKRRDHTSDVEKEYRRLRNIREAAVDHERDPPDDASPPGGLVFQTFADMAADVDAAGEPQWLLRGLWPAGDYGVHAAEHKAGKTWNVVDLAVSVASGTPWLGTIPVDTTGPVVMFVGEGGPRNTVRRVRAVARSRGIEHDNLPIIVCTKAPKLSDNNHLQAIAAQLEHTRPVLVSLDPLYLSAAGGNLADLYAMGELLQSIQHICQHFGSALIVTTHFNRKAGAGSARISGAGPAEWGRVLVSVSVKSRRTDADTLATDVVTELDVIGGEVPDQTYRVHRRIWADDPESLSSPLHVKTTAELTVEGTQAADPAAPTPTQDTFGPAAQKLLEALAHHNGAAVTGKRLVDQIAAVYGNGLKRETVSREMNKLEAAGLVVGTDQGPGRQKLWQVVDPPTPTDP